MASASATKACRHTTRPSIWPLRRTGQPCSKTSPRHSGDCRARWWENTLVTMAGLPGQSPEQLIQAILAGSTLVEGDQVYLASRCFIDTRKADGTPASVVDQIVDSLIWRSHPGNLRPYADRKRAATALAELRHPNAIPHLVSLASEEIATGWGTDKRYEFSGIRLIAVNGLMLMQDTAKEYVVKEDRKSVV